MKRPFSSLSLGMTLGVTALGAQSTVPGWFEESRLVTTPTNSSLPGSTSVIRSWHAGVRTRTETEVAGRARGTYSLVLDTSGTRYFVSPGAKTIRVMAFGDLERETIVELSTAAKELERVEDLGPGESMLGLATRRFRATSSFKMNLSAFGDSTPRTVHYTRTIWLASDSTHPVIRAVMRTARRSPSSNLPGGVAMLSEIVMNGVTPGGTMTIHSQVQGLRLVDIDTAQFTLPPDYRRISMSEEMRAMQPNLAGTRQQAAASEASYAELRRLHASANPRDKARARALVDSLIKANKPDSARLRELMLNDPNAVRITEPAPTRKKP